MQVKFVGDWMDRVVEYIGWLDGQGGWMDRVVEYIGWLDGQGG